MQTTLRVVKLIALGLVALLGSKLLDLTKQSHEAVFSGKVQLPNSVPFSLAMALHHFEWTILICIAFLSLVFMLFNVWRFQSVENRLRRLTGPSHPEKI